MRHGLRLEYATLGWNVVGVPLLVVAAIRSGSAAAAGFGLDSAIQIVASLVVVWELTGRDDDRERLALRLISLAFAAVAVAVYVTALAAFSLIGDHEPKHTPLGIVWTGLTVVVMLSLARGMAITGRALGNPLLTVEGRVMLVDACLAASVLLGLSLNALLGWWSADPLAGLVVVVYAILEARSALAQRTPYLPVWRSSQDGRVTRR